MIETVKRDTIKSYEYNVMILDKNNDDKLFAFKNSWINYERQ